jgi:hypothetical protein
MTGWVNDANGLQIQKGSVVLWKDGRGKANLFVGGRFAATLSIEGRYRVELKGPDFAKLSQELQVEQGRVSHMKFTLQPGGVKGKVTRMRKAGLYRTETFSIKRAMLSTSYRSTGMVRIS